MKRLIFMIISILFLITPIPDQAEAQNQLWVSANHATLKAARGSSSETLAQLPVGLRLTVLSYKRRWYQVTTPDGVTGWIYRGKVSKQPPATEKKSGQDGAVGRILGDISGDSGIRADAADTSRSIRGLSPEAAEYARKTDKPEIYKKALDKVLAIRTTDAQINWFLKKGKIGEYAD